MMPERFGAAGRQKGELPSEPIPGRVLGWRWPHDQAEIGLAIVIPAYNEAARLPRLLAGLAEHCDPATTQIIVVDDGSSDNTAKVARAGLASFPNSQVERFEANRGKGAALRHGIDRARGGHVMFMDADMATDLRDIAPMRKALETADVAAGSRIVEGALLQETQLSRRVMRTSFNWLVRLATDVRVRDSQCGFKAFRGSTARLLFHLSCLDGFGQDVEVLDLAARLGLNVAEVPVRWKAIEGSKVRPVRDSFVLAASVGRLALGPATKAELPMLSVADRPDTVADTAERLRSVVRATDAVLATDQGAHVLLPASSPTEVATVARRVTNELGAVTDHVIIDGRSLIKRVEHDLRST